MITQKFILERRYWKVYVYYNITKQNALEIINKLQELNLPKSYITGAYITLISNKFNQGLTETNLNKKESVIVFTKTTSASQFINSFVHEIGHLASHIGIAYNLDLSGEEVQYIAGDIAQIMFKKCNKLMCECCRKH